MTWINELTKDKEIFDTWKSDSLQKEWLEGLIKIKMPKYTSRETTQ